MAALPRKRCTWIRTLALAATALAVTGIASASNIASAFNDSGEFSSLIAVLVISLRSEWRDPEGGYRFDMLKANFPKWLPCYLERDFCDERGCHVPVWSTTLFPEGTESVVSKKDFTERFTALEFTMPLGPKGTIKPEASEPSAEAVDALWLYLCGDTAAEELEAAQALRRIQEMAPDTDSDPERSGAIGEGPDFVDWKNFAKALGAAPFERFA